MLAQVFSDDLDGHDDVDYLPEEHAFSATTIELMNIFLILDERPGIIEDKDELVRNMHRRAAFSACSTASSRSCH